MMYSIRMNVERRHHTGFDYKVVGVSSTLIPAFNRRDAREMAQALNNSPSEYQCQPYYSEHRWFEPVLVHHARGGKVVLSFDEVKDLVEEWQTQPDNYM